MILGGGRLISFGNDTVLFFSADSWSPVFRSAQEGFSTVLDWLRQNILTLTIDKSKYTYSIFNKNAILNNKKLHCIKAHNEPTCDIPWCCDCPLLSRTDNITNLGVMVDNNLSFRPHINLLVNRFRILVNINVQKIETRR